MGYRQQTPFPSSQSPIPGYLLCRLQSSSLLSVGQSSLQTHVHIGLPDDTDKPGSAHYVNDMYMSQRHICANTQIFITAVHTKKTVHTYKHTHPHGRTGTSSGTLMHTQGHTGTGTMVRGHVLWRAWICTNTTPHIAHTHHF